MEVREEGERGRLESRNQPPLRESWSDPSRIKQKGDGADSPFLNVASSVRVSSWHISIPRIWSMSFSLNSYKLPRNS